MVDELRDLVEGRFGRTPGRRSTRRSCAPSSCIGDGRDEEPPVDLDALRDGRRRARVERGGAAPARALRRGGRAAAALDPRALGRRRVARRARRRPGARREDPRGRADRAGDRRRRDHDRGGRHARQRPPHGRAGRTRRAPAAPAAPGGEAELPPVAPRDDSLVRVESPMVGTFYRAPAPGAAAFVEEGDAGRRRADALHPRGDEADERGEGRGRGRRARDPRRRRRAGRVRPAALRARAGQRPPLDAV